MQAMAKTQTPGIDQTILLKLQGMTLDKKLAVLDFVDFLERDIVLAPQRASAITLESRKRPERDLQPRD